MVKDNPDLLAKKVYLTSLTISVKLNVHVYFGCGFPLERHFMLKWSPTKARELENEGSIIVKDGPSVKKKIKTCISVFINLVSKCSSHSLQMLLLLGTGIKLILRT